MLMMKRIGILMVSSFIFNVIFGMVLSRNPDLFLSIQKKVSGESARNMYKLLFLLTAALIVVFLNEYLNLHEIVSFSILGLSLSFAGIVFREIEK